MDRCLAIGSHVASVCMNGDPNESLETHNRLAEHWFDITREAAETFIATVHERTIEARRQCDRPVGELNNPDEVIAKANE